jgi:endonuclease/exonuclease/phosphatase (EEP) superfamily protein YafD
VRVRAVVAWLLVVPCAAWVAMRLFGLERGFPLVPLVSYTPLVTIGVLAVVAVAALLRQRVPALVAAALAAALVVAIAPRALGGPTAAEGGSGPALRVMTANMRFGSGSPEALVELVRRTRPDVLSVQELTPDLERRLFAAGLDELLPEGVSVPRTGGGGMGLYARMPLVRRDVLRSTRNPILVASVRLPGAAPVEVAAVHPPPPLRHRLSQWRRDLRAVPAATPQGSVRVVAGDFNATLDHAELRRILDTGYEDAAAEVGAGLRATWPAGRRLPPPVTIDHVLADRRCGVREVSVHTIPGSDHRAVVAELVLPRG